MIPERGAWDILSRTRRGFTPGFRRRSNSPKRVELIYLPYFLVDFHPNGNEKIDKVTMAVDGVVGNAILFAQDSMNYGGETNGPTCDFSLSREEAKQIASEEFRGLRLEHQMRRRSLLSTPQIAGIGTIYYPFWVGYFRRKKGYDFKAVDAVSGAVQGVKMRKVFLKAFRQMA